MKPSSGAVRRVWPTREMLGSAVMKGGQGAIHGAFYEYVPGRCAAELRNPGPSGTRAKLGVYGCGQCSGSVQSVPLPMGTLGFFARVADTMDRDVGRITKISEIPGDIQKRLEARLPGLRNTASLSARMFGQPVSNPAGGGWAVSPFRVGQGSGRRRSGSGRKSPEARRGRGRYAECSGRAYGKGIRSRLSRKSNDSSRSLGSGVQQQPGSPQEVLS
jgi:hypothetical protein